MECCCLQGQQVKIYQGQIKVLDWDRHLFALGMMRQVSCGIQLDINAAAGYAGNKRIIGSLCDHNCTREYGYYNCPAARSQNPGLKIENLAPGDKLLQGLKVAIAGIKAATEQFLLEGLEPYSQSFKVPADVTDLFAALLKGQKVEVNITGGNPEIHPDIFNIFKWLSDNNGVATNLTTTGRRFVIDSQFSTLLLQNPPDVIAFSADSFDTAEQIATLADMSREELVAAWQAVPANHGQRQKAIEAIYAASVLQNSPVTEIAFNLVVHPGNIDTIEDIIRTLAECFPKSHIFPYPAQAGFNESGLVFHDSAQVERFVDRMLRAHFEDDLPVTKRLQYWLMLKAVLETYRGQESLSLAMLSGRNLWKCYVSPWTIRYLQVGKPCSSEASVIGGGFLGCFWNSCTIAQENKQVWEMGLAEVVDFIKQGASKLASARSSPCPGCGFPRLMFDVISSEMGLNDALVPCYLELRKHYAGY